MPFDTLISNPGRLRILTALVSQNPMEFVQLRRVTSLTDGNLSSHARRLHEAGLLVIDKTFRSGKPVTTFTLTTDGKQRLTAHVTALMEMVTHGPTLSTQPSPDLMPDQPSPISFTKSLDNSYTVEEDWVD